MNKSGYIKVILGFLVIFLLYGCFWPMDAEAADSKLDVGRDNPFAKIAKKQMPAPRKVRKNPLTVEEVPDLFIETVTIKYLDAKNLASVVEKMVSDYGSVSTDEKTNSLIICDTKEYIERILEQIAKMEEMMSQQDIVVSERKPELFVKSVTLKFLDGKKLMEAIGKMSSDYGSISFDETTNSLVICDTEENIERILAEIKKADKTPEQIMIEVVILDVKLDDDTEIGVNWDLLAEKPHTFSYRQNLATRLGWNSADTTGVTNATLFDTTGLGGNFTIVNNTIRNVIHLIQKKKDVEILASPRAMMVSGESAYIEAVEEVPYTEESSTSGGGELETTEFKDVGVKFNVSATLVENDVIFLTVDTEQNVKTGVSISNVPVVDTRKARSSLLLKDGQVVVFGGLRRQEKTKEVEQIPILGNIPILGELFKNTNTVIKHSELVIFLSPHVYKGEPIPEEAMAKFNEITTKPLISIPDKKGLLEKLSQQED